MAARSGPPRNPPSLGAHATPGAADGTISGVGARGVIGGGGGTISGSGRVVIPRGASSGNISGAAGATVSSFASYAEGQGSRSASHRQQGGELMGFAQRLRPTRLRSKSANPTCSPEAAQNDRLPQSPFNDHTLAARIGHVSPATSPPLSHRSNATECSDTSSAKAAREKRSPAKAWLSGMARTGKPRSSDPPE